MPVWFVRIVLLCVNSGLNRYDCLKGFVFRLIHFPSGKDFEYAPADAAGVVDVVQQ